MISAFLVRPAASGCELCDIDIVWIILYNSELFDHVPKKLGYLGKTKIYQ